VMRDTAVSLGVPDRDIVLDYAGFNSWDSCYRAREVFGLQSATLVTQKFHLPRALFGCNHLNVKAVGVIADRQNYPTTYNEAREYLGIAGMAWRILVNDQPRFLGPKVDIDAVQER
jgi:vancomycin permeability regulator SanA